MWEPALAGWHAPDKVRRVPRQGSVSPCACSSLLARPVGGRYLHLRHGGAWHGRPLPLRLRLGEGAPPPPPPLFSVPLPRVAFPAAVSGQGAAAGHGASSALWRAARPTSATCRRRSRSQRVGTGQAQPESPSRRAAEPESHGAGEPESQPEPEPE